MLFFIFGAIIKLKPEASKNDIERIYMLKLRAFDYAKKESYTQSEVEALIRQNQEFVEGQYKEHVKPYYDQERVARIAANLPKTANATLAKDIAKLVELPTDMAEFKALSDDAVKAKLEAYIKENKHFQVAETPPKENKKEVPEPKADPKPAPAVKGPSADVFADL